MKRVQVAVVGGGDAGMKAAHDAAKHGAEVVLFDEQAVLGGTAPYGGESSISHRVYDAGAEVQLNSVVWGLFEGNVLGVSNGESSQEFPAEQIILATGSTDLPCPFTGGSLPGVFTSRAILKMFYVWRIMPGNRFVVVGDGKDADFVASSIERTGGEIVARIAEGALSRFAVVGDQGVEAVVIDGERVPADIVVIGAGRQPDIELALMAGCEIGFNSELGGFVPTHDDYLRTSRPEILVAGNAAGLCRSDLVAMNEGGLAGVSAAAALGLVDIATLEGVHRKFLERFGDRAELAGQVQPSYVQV